MNEQRRVIYRIRRDILGDKGNREFVNEMTEDVCLFLVDSYRPDREKFHWRIGRGVKYNRVLKTPFIQIYEINMEECSQKHDGNIEDYFIATSRKTFCHKSLMPTKKNMVKMALREILLSTFRSALEGAPTWEWIILKEGINLKSYAQRDPLTEYKREGFQLFESMRIKVKESLVRNLFRVQLYTVEEMEEMQRRHQEELERQLAAHKRAQMAQAQAQDNSSKDKEAVRQPTRVGRNAPCPCGSGKKFKHCCGS